MLKVGFTGTEYKLTEKQKEVLVKTLQDIRTVELHHGDCVGADSACHYIALDLGINIVVHPPINPRLRAFCKNDIVLPQKPYLERNHDIVDVTDVLVACPYERGELLRSGTWATIRYARKMHRKIYVIFNDGSVRVEG